MSEKQSFYKRMWWKYGGILVLIVLAIVIILTSNNDKETEANEAVEIAEVDKPFTLFDEKVDYNYEGLSREDAIKQAVDEAMGDENYVEHFEKDGKLWLIVDISEGSSRGLIRMFALKDSVELAELFEEYSLLGDTDELIIEFNADLLDAYGNAEHDAIMQVGFSTKTLAKINYENVDSDNIPEIADFYWEHSVFSGK